MRILLLLLVALLTSMPAARAVQPDEILRDAGLETRARAISAGLRCLVCQNQSIDDSDAPLARDLRLIVRERLVAGDSDEAVTSFVVARYGDFVLLKPPFGPATLVLWLTPLLVLAGAAGYLLRHLRPGATVAAGSDALSPEEEAHLQSVLKVPPDEKT